MQSAHTARDFLAGFYCLNTCERASVATRQYTQTYRDKETDMRDRLSLEERYMGDKGMFAKQELIDTTAMQSFSTVFSGWEHVDHCFIVSLSWIASQSQHA